MYTTKERLLLRSGKKNKLDRFSYLKQLYEEYITTQSKEASKQVLANLANFSYDPINYEYIRCLGIVDLFLGELESSNDDIVHFSLAGICNLCLDLENRDYILSTEGALEAIKDCLSSTDEEIVLNAITTLIFLTTPSSQKRITSKETVEHIVAFSLNPNPRIHNLANIFLTDICTPHQVREGKKSLNTCLKDSH